MRGGLGHRQEGRGAGQAQRGRDSAPGAMATRAAALCKEQVGAKYALTSPALLTAPAGSGHAARWPLKPPAITTGCRAAASTATVHPGCSDSTLGPPTWPVPRYMALGTPETQLPGPKSPAQQQWWGRVCPAGPASLSPAKSRLSGHLGAAEVCPLNPSGSASPAVKWDAAAQFCCRGAGDPRGLQDCWGAAGAKSRLLPPP